ncbi:MAG: M16 family metallopeptidase [Flavobacteriales bacterium]
MYEIQPVLFTLSNGIRVVYLHAPAQVAHLGVTVLGGSRFEKEEEDGLAHFLEHCIFKGTSKRKAFHILSRLDSVGGELNAYTAKEEICVYASFTKEHIRRASDLLADITLNSNFPLREIHKEKDIIIDEINSYLDSPGDKIFDDFEAHLFKGHALGNNILGTKERIQGFTRDNLLDYMKRFFTADNMVISFVGDISRKKLEKILEEDFKHCPIGQHKGLIAGFKPHKVFHVRSKEANYQVHAVVGGIAPNYKDEARRGMTLLTNILGGPALNSRLTLSIREKYGYSYNIEANYTPYVDTGFWSIYLGTDAKYIDRSIALIHKELRLICTKKLGVLQLNQAKEQLKGHMALGLDSNSGLMLGLGKSLLLFNQIDTIQEIYAGIDKLTAEELLEIANSYFDPENCSELIFDLQVS